MIWIIWYEGYEAVCHLTRKNTMFHLNNAEIWTRLEMCAK